MKKTFIKRVFALSCAAVLCIGCAISASATSKTSTTGDYSTNYGTFNGKLDCARGTSTAAATASTSCHFDNNQSQYLPKLYAEVELQHWSSGNTIDSDSKSATNSIGVTTDTVSGSASSYVTAWGSHVLYNSSGSQLLKKGTQTVKV